MFDFDDALSRVKVKIMMKPNTAFISAVMMALDFHEDSRIPTACTNGLCIRVNPEFFASLDEGQRMFLILHETWHVAFDHITRLNQREPKKWNHATDYVINGQLVQEGFKFIEGGLLDSKYTGLSADEVYDLLPENFDNQSNSLDGDIESPGDGSGSEADQARIEEARVKMQEIVARAAMQAEMSNQAGTIPESIRRAIEEARNPKLPWNVLLEQYMNERVQDEYSWNKRNRRFSHVYLPSLDNEGMGEVRCYVDCSGSITQKELALEVAEMCYIKEVSNPSRMVLRAFACNLGREQSFSRDEELDFDADTSGGTCLEPVWRDVKRNTDTEVVVIFTDGYVSVPPTAGMPDIVWVIVNNENWDGDKSGNRIIHMTI